MLGNEQDRVQRGESGARIRLIGPPADRPGNPLVGLPGELALRGEHGM